MLYTDGNPACEEKFCGSGQSFEVFVHVSDVQPVIPFYGWDGAVHPVYGWGRKKWDGPV